MFRHGIIEYMNGIETPKTLILPQIAKNKTHALELLQNGIDPVIFRLNEFEVEVYTRRQDVVENVRSGQCWSITNNEQFDNALQTNIHGVYRHAIN